MPRTIWKEHFSEASIRLILRIIRMPVLGKLTRKRFG